jgi:hypothetical protein
MTQTNQATEVKAFVTGAARAAYETITPQFERDTGHKLVTHFDLPPARSGRSTPASPTTSSSCPTTSTP